MMFFDNSRVMKTEFVSYLSGRSCVVIVGAVLLMLACLNVSAQTLVEEVELPNSVVLQSGVPIPELGEAVQRAIVIDSEVQSEQLPKPGIKEYRLGTKTVREYHVGKQLQHVEIIDASGAIYIVDHNRLSTSTESNSRSGVLVSTW